MKIEKNAPTEAEIEDLLQAIQPQPSPRFHQLMDSQPWNKNERKLRWRWAVPLRFATTVGLIAIILLGVSLFSPAANTFAQRFTQFFFPVNEEKISTAINIREIDYPLGRFNLSLAEAEAVANFTIVTPLTSPMGFMLTGVAYDAQRQVTIQNFTTADGMLVLRLSQQPLRPDFQSIGPAAQIENVRIGPYEGEYVIGGWMIPISEVKSGIDAEAVWDPTANFQTLRWSDGEFLYELFLAGDMTHPAYINKEKLIAFAIQMQ